jgi:nitrate/nitrite transporter NarK
MACSFGYISVSGNHIVISRRPHDLSIHNNDAVGIVDIMICAIGFVDSFFVPKINCNVMKTENTHAVHSILVWFVIFECSLQ